MLSRQRRNRRGFTLVELLVTVAIIGIIGALLVPNLLDSLQKAKQKRTLADMRDVGTAWYSWFTDQVSAAASGQSGTGGTYDFAALDTPLTAAELYSTLYTDFENHYIREIPRYDGWGVDYDYRWGAALDYTAVIGIRSYGRDRVEGPDTDPYTMGPFDANAYDEDIVWADGFFIQYPTGAAVQ